MASNCTTGDVRLVGNADGDEGRLEVCVNGAWGTVCSDGFDTNDASVACQSLEGFSGSGESCDYKMIGTIVIELIELLASLVNFMNSLFLLLPADPEILTSSFQKGSGPIFLDQLQCSGSDQSLFDCDMGQTIGLHHCNHSMDVGIKCSGKQHSWLDCTCFAWFGLDIDECSEGVSNCSENSNCTNTIGSYQCSCFSGYQDEGMGYVCAGI